MFLPTAPSQFFVVLSDGLAKWRKGDVVAGGVLLQQGCDINRLLSINSMRPATEAEASKQHIEIIGPERHASYEQQLVDKNKEITRLTARVCSLEEQLAAGTHVSQPALSALNESALIEEKDRAIKTLEAKSVTLMQDLTAARAEVAAARSELATYKREAAEADAAKKPVNSLPTPAISPEQLAAADALAQISTPPSPAAPPARSAGSEKLDAREAAAATAAEEKSTGRTRIRRVTA